MRKIEDYNRVTDILYPFAGYGSIDPYILNNAAERGKKVHMVCDAIISDMGMPEIDESIKPYIDSFNLYLEEHPKRFIANSRRFFCDVYQITGEVDAIYESTYGTTLVDFKTSAREGRTWGCQGSAYVYLAQLENIKIERIEFVMLSKTGNRPSIIYYEEDFEGFLECYSCYNKYFKTKLERLGEYI